MRKEQLTIEHKELLQQKLNNIDSDLSEYCFSNLYLFRKTHHYHLNFVEDDLFYIDGITYDGKTHIMPTCDITILEDSCFSLLLEEMMKFDIMYPVPEEWLPLFPPDRFIHSYNDDDSDYIFTTEKLAHYPGRKLHKKRNLLKQFNEMYESTQEPLSPENILHAFTILEEWQKDSGLSPEDTDYNPCREALEMMQKLELHGTLFYADASPAGFILGEEINNRVFGLHFAKGNKDIKGIYQYMFNRCTGIRSGKYQYLNLEQDLGKSSLRNAKASYQPDHFARKYRVQYKN